MKRLLLAISLATLGSLSLAASSQADFGLHDFDVSFLDPNGAATLQAGSHPYAMRTSFAVNTIEGPNGGEIVAEATKDSVLAQIPGLVGDSTAIPRCSTAEFLSGGGVPACSDSSAIGTAIVTVGQEIGTMTFATAIYNLEPPPGVPVKLGFIASEVPVSIDIGVSQSPPYNVIGSSRNISYVLEFRGFDVSLWGNPADPAHDGERGRCLVFGGICPASIPNRPFLTLPRACAGPLATSYEVDSWSRQGVFTGGSVLTHDDAEPPNPRGMNGCGKLDFSPAIATQPTSRAAESPSGLDFDLTINDEGLTNPKGIAGSDIRKAVVTLPEGVTLNPSAAEGLGVCTPAGLQRESIATDPGEGCPNASKLGTVHVESPLIEEPVDGQVYLAQQDDPATAKPGAENPFDSLIAFYIVLQNRKLGISIKLAAKVEPDPRTGRLITTVDNAPQLPVSRFNFHFREGARSPLVTPPSCGTYKTKAELTPWSGNPPVTTTSSFTIVSGVHGDPCPPGGIPPFKPEYEAGSINNNAKSYSPFFMRLIRHDGEQDMTKFSSILPPGVLGKLAGVSKCPDAAIAAAKAKTGRQELASPSCPANSEIGHTLAGAGVGSALTFVPGKVYLGGPYKGDPLSVISVTPAVAGPFDAGTVVVRLALTLNPETAEVEVDGAASDPIPHILKGIVLKVRDIRVYVDRPQFIINPTSCEPSSAKATLFGGFVDVFNPAGDVPISLATRYQAANCATLPFKPKLSLRLKGGTERGDHPALSSVLIAKPNEANIASAVVTLPRSAFLDQSHIRTICTRVQFAAHSCPRGSQYGYAKAFTPLLDEPVQGPVYLRSSNHKLPDLVIALHGLVDVNVVARIDSKRGGIRTSFETVPDAPVSKFLLRLEGGQKGLIVNSRDLCRHQSRVDVLFGGQNGKPDHFHPPLRARCGGGANRGAR